MQNRWGMNHAEYQSPDHINHLEPVMPYSVKSRTSFPDVFPLVFLDIPPRPQDESDPNKADLHIYTYIDNEAIQVYSGELDTRSDENRDKWGSEGTPYVLVCTREV